jgi:hypothetical protein
MPTIPTGKLERELRALYLRWVSGLSMDDKNLQDKMASFTHRAQDLIEREGGKVAMLGALGDFPAPRSLELSPYIGKVYDQMQLAAVQASITTGLNSRDAARAMFRAGMDKSYRRLERIARTETVSAYWKNAWGSIAALPSLVMVWGSEDGPRTCPWCRERDGLVMEDSNLRDHPSGRCTPIPTLRSMVEYRGSVRRDGSIYYDDRWGKGQAKDTVPMIQPTVSPEEALARYTTSEAFSVNNALRTGSGIPDIVAGLDKALAAASLPERTPVRRVLSGEGAAQVRAAIKNKIPLVDDGYVSTQKASYGSIQDQIEDFAPGMSARDIIVLESELPKGTHAIDVGLNEAGLGFDQGEVLLPRGTRVFIGDLVRRVGGVAVYRVTFRPPP